MVANQPTLCTTVSGLQPRAAMAATAATAARSLPTAYLFGARAAQQRFDAGRLVRASRDEDAELVVGKARIVLDGPNTPRGEQRVQENAEDRRQRPEENRHFEHDDDVGRNREDRFAADHQGPVTRHPQ